MAKLQLVTDEYRGPSNPWRTHAKELQGYYSFVMDSLTFAQYSTLTQSQPADYRRIFERALTLTRNKKVHAEIFKALDLCNLCTREER